MYYEIRYSQNSEYWDKLKKNGIMKMYSKLLGLAYRLKYNIIVEWYNFLYIVLARQHKFIPKIASIDETIKSIINTKCSVSRYGDGEILLTNSKKSIGFQDGNEDLAQRLNEIIQSNQKNHIVCISDAFCNLNRYNRNARRFWRTHFFLYADIWDNLLLPQKQYYNTFVTRPYMDFYFKDQCEKWFRSIKAIWDKRDIIFIEGEKSRLGVGNDLFKNAHSIRRILCPSCNAFDKYTDIYKEAIKQEQSVLFLIALGPTATVLSYDLCCAGYQAIDVGHLDVEYGGVWGQNGK